MKRYIYADNAATTKIDDEAYEAMLPWLLSEYGNPSQPYSFSRAPKKAILTARREIAELINANPEEIYFTSGGTESDNWAIKGIALTNKDKGIITSSIEHHAILNACKAVEKLGCNVSYLSPDNQGIISPDTLEHAITDNIQLVSVMFSNNEIGTIQPIEALAEVAHHHGSLFHTDAVQAIGHCHIDVKKMGIDLLSASAHKFNGPKGIGFLYIRHGVDISPLNDGGAQEYGKRAGTENVANIVAMAVALKNNCAHLDENVMHIESLEKRLIEKLNGIDYIRNGSDLHIPGNISLSFRNIDGETLLHRLDLKGIFVSTGSACDSVNTQLSHVIRAINVPGEYAYGTIRISIGKNNTEEEIDAIADAIKHILKDEYRH